MLHQLLCLYFGDLIVVEYPFSDLSDHKRRPAFVLQEHQEDILICFVGSRLEKKKKDDLVLKKNSSNQLLLDSILKINKIFTIHKKYYIKKIGSESEASKKIIKSKLIAMIKAL